MRTKILIVLTLLFVVLLPTQFGKHFFFNFSFISGVRVDYLAPTLYITDIVALFLIALEFTKIKEWVRGHVVPVLILLGLVGVNIVFSSHPIVGAYILLKYIEVIGVGLVFYFSKIRFSQIIFAFTLSAGFELFLSITQIVTHGSIQGIFYFLGERYMSANMPSIAKVTLQGVEILRPYATFSHPNSLGGFYLLTYALVLFQTKLKLQKNFSIFSYIFLLLSSFLVLFSFSKSAIIGWMAISLLYMFFYIKNACQLCRLGRIVGTMTVGLFFLSALHGDASVQERFVLMKQGTVLFFQKPFFGFGLGQHLYGLAQFPATSPYFFNQPIHNIFLLGLIEWGSLLFTVVFFNIYKLFQKRRRVMWIILGIIVFTGFFDHYWLTLQQNLLLIGAIGGMIFNKTNPSIRE